MQYDSFNNISQSVHFQFKKQLLLFVYRLVITNYSSLNFRLIYQPLQKLDNYTTLVPRSWHFLDSKKKNFQKPYNENERKRGEEIETRPFFFFSFFPSNAEIARPEIAIIHSFPRNCLIISPRFSITCTLQFFNSRQVVDAADEVVTQFPHRG